MNHRPSQGFSRRTFLAGSSAAAVAATTVPLLASPASADTTFIKGADVGWVPQMEANGYYWLDQNGVERDILDILTTDYGLTGARVRAFVDPDDDPVDGHCSSDEMIALAKRCRTAGMEVMVDMILGDTWNSVGKQNPPAAWADMTYAETKQAIYDYVYHLMNLMKANHVTPSWVQLGNETNLGVCLPVGSITAHPDQVAGLLTAAHDMVKEVFPSAQTIVHLAKPQNSSDVISWLDAYADNGGQWDICGFSSYASGTDTIDTIVSNYQTYQSRYGKPVMQVEWGGQYNRATRVKRDLTYFIEQNREAGVLGLFYWEPEQYIPFDTYTMGAWDPDTRMPTVGLDGFLA